MKAKKQRRKHKTPQKKGTWYGLYDYLEKKEKRGKAFQLYGPNSNMMKSIRGLSDIELMQIIRSDEPVLSKLCLRELHEREYGKVS